jgi:hypothetical protein
LSDIRAEQKENRTFIRYSKSGEPMRKASRCAAIIALISASFSTQLLAQAGKKDDGSNPDEPAIHDFILTMPKIQKYSDVVKKLSDTGKGDSVMAAEMKKISDTDVYNVQKAAMIDKSPHLAAFLKANGLTGRDFVLTPMVTLTAAMATAAQDMKVQAPDFVNPANIQFVRDHKAELEKYNLMGGEKESEKEPEPGPDDKQQRL